VSTNGEPLAQFAMVDDKELSVLNDEDGYSEIDFFVDVWHGVGRLAQGLG